MIKKYSWGFRGARGVELSVYCEGPDSVGRIRLNGGSDSGMGRVQAVLKRCLDMDGHEIQEFTTPTNLDYLTKTRLKVFRPYATHPHAIPPPDRTLKPGVVS